MMHAQLAPETKKRKWRSYPVARRKGRTAPYLPDSNPFGKLRENCSDAEELTVPYSISQEEPIPRHLNPGQETNWDLQSLYFVSLV
jgi:hypothetical protein